MPAKESRHERRCICGAKYLNRGKCTAGGRCPRSELGHGEWERTLHCLEAMSPSQRRERYPGLDLMKLRRHVERHPPRIDLGSS